jgi:RNA polymerase sigma factor (sigma-70 family)
MVMGVCRRVLRDSHAADDVFQAAFLVLVRKAASIARRDSVGSWLFRVAYNMALRSKAAQGRRQAAEKQARVPASPSSGHEADWADVQPVLDEEVNRLPEKYRAPVVLCYLEGKAYEEAARELGCPIGTLSVRLARARDQLQKRLTRRGVTPSATALAALLAQQAQAAPAPALLTATKKAASLVAATQTIPTDAVPAAVVTLTRGALRDMFFNNLKRGLLGGVVLLLAGLGVAVALPAASPPLDEVLAQAEDNQAAPAKKRGQTEPAGAPLEVRLVAKKDTYRLDLGAEFRKQLQGKTAGKQLPDAPKVDLALEFGNVGDAEIRFWVGGDYTELQLELDGPKPVHVTATNKIANEQLYPEVIKLAPGKTYQLPITSLQYGLRNLANRAYWTEPGEYQLTASYRTAVSPTPKDAKAAINYRGFPVRDFGIVTCISAPVKLKVEGK